MKSINILLLIHLSISCIRTETHPPSDIENNSTYDKKKTKIFAPRKTNTDSINRNLNIQFYKSIKGVQYIDARTIYPATITGDFSKISKVTFTFEGKSRPSLSLYSNDFRGNQTSLTLIPPSFRDKTVIIKQFNSNNSLVKQFSFKLSTSSINHIEI